MEKINCLNENKINRQNFSFIDQKVFEFLKILCFEKKGLSYNC